MYTAGAVDVEGWSLGIKELALPIRLGVCGASWASSGVWGGAPAANDFVAFWAYKTTLVALKISYSGSLAVINFCVSTLKTAM